MQQLRLLIRRLFRPGRWYPRYDRVQALARRGAVPVVSAIGPALAAAVALGGAVSILHAETARLAIAPVMVVNVNGAIGVATSEYISRTLVRAQKERAALVVLRLDTPGGLLSSTREIIRAILGSTVPVAVYVAPAGARAASAGTYMIYAAHVAAMAHGTHLGAATPISLLGPGQSSPARDSDKDGNKKNGDERDGFTTAERKIVNDAAAYLRSLAQLRGRNAEWAERAVRTAATLTAEEARKENVIDLLADDVPDLLAMLDGRIVAVAGGERRLATKGAPVVELTPDWRTSFLSIIGDPNIAYLLLLLGFFGIVLEFLHPGAVAPGVIGGVSLLVGLGSLSILPIDYAGLALILLGIALMVGEALTPGVAILGIGGVSAFVVGSLFLFDPVAAPGIEFRVSWPLVAAAAILSAALLVFGLRLALKARRRPVVSGREEMIGSLGTVLAWSAFEGTVHVHGEVWAARSTSPLRPGDTVRIFELEGLTAIVAPASQPETARRPCPTPLN